MYQSVPEGGRCDMRAKVMLKLNIPLLVLRPTKKVCVCA